MFISIIIFIFTLLILVLIHELGHFLMAKKFNIKVEEFGFGIPPRAWGKKIGETLISINWLPFGGFVRLLGEDEVGPLHKRKGSETSRYFMDRPVGQRIAVVLAGVVMNFILACLIFYITLGFGGFKFQIPLLLDHKFLGTKQEVESLVVIADVSKDSPAAGANLQIGDQILSLNDEPIKGNQDLVNKTKALAGKEINLTISDVNREKRIVKIIPRENPPEGQGPLGIALATVRLANLEYQGTLQKLFAGPIHSWNLVAYSGKVLGKVLNQSFINKTLEPVAQSISGPVGITALANDILTKASKPALVYLDFIALLSLNLAVVNLLPIPALDGGRLFFLMIEAISRKRVHAEVEKWIHMAGMAILLTLALLITFSDIGKLFP